MTAMGITPAADSNQLDSARRAARQLDRKIACFILLLSLVTYSYIFQGIGWNQIAHFGTIRSIVERGTAEISPFTDITRDTMLVGTRQYSSKPPGLPLLGVPFYFVLFHIERSLGIAYENPTVWVKNLHLLTVLLCALPGAWLNMLVYYAFRREAATPRTSMILAGGFAFGSLSLPYSGLFMSHMLCAFLVFAAWYVLTTPSLRPSHALLAGTLIGYSNLCDLLTIVVTLGMALYFVACRTDRRCWVAFAIGPCAALCALLVYDRLAHGSALQVSPFHPSGFQKPHLLFGQFDWPDIRRIYWITYQPMRGLIACCPEFVLCLMAPVMLLRQSPLRRRPDLLIILPMLAGYLLFYMTFSTWTGGFAVGPRFLIPALPLIWMFALRPFQKMPAIGGVAIGLSVIYMLAVTSVCAVDGSDGIVPTKSDPVGSDLTVFFHGRVTDVWDSETLGGLMGLPDRFLIFPFLLPVVVYFSIALAIRPTEAGKSLPTAHARSCSI